MDTDEIAVGVDTMKFVIRRCTRNYLYNQINRRSRKYSEVATLNYCQQLASLKNTILVSKESCKYKKSLEPVISINYNRKKYLKMDQVWVI